MRSFSILIGSLSERPIEALDGRGARSGAVGSSVMRALRLRLGGRAATGRDVLAWAEEVVRLGAGEILLTSMDRDGTREGYDIELTRMIADAVSVPVIASGGVGNLDHLVAGVREGHASAVLAASIFHFGEAMIGEAKERMARAGIPMRL